MIFMSLSTYSKVTLDEHGNLYIADSANSRIRFVWLSHCNSNCGKIFTIAGGGEGNPRLGWLQATNAHIGFPEAISMDSRGRLYMSSR